MEEIVKSILITYGVIVNIHIATLITMTSTLNRLPQEFRSMRPWKVFLNIIPLFNFGWFFSCVMEINYSYKKYSFAQKKKFANINFGLGIALGILNIFAFIPFANYLVIIPWLVITILYNISISNCKKQTYRTAQ